MPPSYAQTAAHHPLQKEERVFPLKKASCLLQLQLGLRSDLWLLVGVARDRLGRGFADVGDLGEQGVAIDGRRDDAHQSDGAGLPSKQLQQSPGQSSLQSQLLGTHRSLQFHRPAVEQGLHPAPCCLQCLNCICLWGIQRRLLPLRLLPAENRRLRSAIHPSDPPRLPTTSSSVPESPWTACRHSSQFRMAAVLASPRQN